MCGMALTEVGNRTENAALESSTDNMRDRADPLTYFWSVTLPHWLDPWAPRFADAFADGAWTVSWRGVSAIAPLLAFAIGFLVPQVWPGMRTVYTESPLFMVLIIAGAILTGPVGVMMLLGHVIAMLVWGSTGLPLRTRHQGLLDYFVRREGSLLISYFLLAIPAIIVPQQARWMAEEMPLPLKTSDTARVGVQAILYAVGCGVLIYLWCQAMPVLIRPVFIWLKMAPRVEAIVPVQQGWHWLVGVAGLMAIVRIVAERMAIRGSSRGSVITGLQEQRWSNPERRDEFWRNIPSLTRLILTSAVVTLVLSGLYQGWIDALLVAVVTILFEIWRAGLIGRFPQPWERAVLKAPALLRFATALFFGYLLSQWIITRQWRGDTFRPVLWATVSTLLIFYFLFPRRTGLEESATERKETE
jgi:hypothetical protein